MKQFLSSAELKSSARVHMFGRYGITVRAYIWMNALLLILTWLFASMNSQGAGSLVSLYIFYAIRFLITGIFLSGSAFLYLNIMSSQPAYPGMIFYGFRNQTDKAVVICLVLSAMELICCVPMLAFFALFNKSGNMTLLIPFGVCALIALAGALAVRVVFLPAYYMIHDFPDYGFKEILMRCPAIMKPHLARAAYVYISFIPLLLLEILSLGAAAPWVSSYINATVTEMYLDIMRKG